MKKFPDTLQNFKRIDYDAKMGTTTATDEVVLIPETFEYNGIKYKTTTLASQSFQNCTNLKKVVVPQSVKSTGTYSFDNCTSLIDVTLPDGCGLSAYSFRSCTSLKNITLPDTVAAIDKYAFANTTSLEKVVLPKSLKTLGAYAFGISGIKEVVVPAEVELEWFDETAIVLYDHDITVSIVKDSWTDNHFDELFDGAFIKKYIE
mgnify:CR=1 FL=1